MKSTALRLGEATPRWLVALLRGCNFALGSGRRAGWSTLAFFLALALAAVQMAWQVATLDLADPANCLARFKSNRLIGWLLLAGLAADMALVAFARCPLLTAIPAARFRKQKRGETGFLPASPR